MASGLGLLAAAALVAAGSGESVTVNVVKLAFKPIRSSLCPVDVRVVEQTAYVQ